MKDFPSIALILSDVSTEAPVIITYRPEGPNLNPKAGAVVELMCEARGVPNPTITWRYNGANRLPSGVIETNPGTLR